jgi:hypothetical protein
VVTLSNDKEAPSNIAARYAQEGVKGGKKRRNQCLQGKTTMINHDDGNDREAGGSGVRHISITVCSDKRPTRPPADHFKRLLEEACPNHAYPVSHKLKDGCIMRSSISSGSLT